MSADDAQLGDRGMFGRFNQTAVHTVFGEPVSEQRASLVPPNQGDELSDGTERGHVEGDVAGAAGTEFVGFNLDDGDWRFGRDAIGRAMPVTVEHDIADYNHAT